LDIGETVIVGKGVDRLVEAFRRGDDCA